MTTAVTGREQTYSVATVLETEICANCNVVFGVPAELIKRRREDGKSFYCPNGHSLVFNNGMSKAERLEQQLRRAREQTARRTAELDQAKSALHGQKIRASRFKNDRDRERARVKAGVCPCCDRTFQNLARHMAGQHPDFAVEPSNG